MRRLGILCVAIGLVTTGCGSSSSTAKSPSPTTQAQTGPKTVNVQIDGKTPAFNASFTAYFPNAVTVHAGDTVAFKSIYTGEPHTVTLGTLVDAGIPKAVAAGPDAPEEPAELKKIPDLLPQGPGDANQVSAQPCYLASGDPPAGDAPCPKAQQPEFDGSQSLYSSGFLADQASFSVKLAKGIKAGTYNYFCTLHRAGMAGKITVVADGQAVPTSDQVTADGKSQLAAKVEKLQPVDAALRTGTLPPFLPVAKPGQLLAGGGSKDVQDAGINEFGPTSVSIPVGGAVTWTVVGPHTISFNAPASAQNVLAQTPDGGVHINMAAVVPAGGPGQPQQSGPPPSGPPPDPSAPPPPPTVVDGGSWDGTGPHSSGIFLSFPPALSAYSLKFTKVGTYNYVCLLHPEMKGSVKVG